MVAALHFCCCFGCLGTQIANDDEDQQFADRVYNLWWDLPAAYSVFYKSMMAEFQNKKKLVSVNAQLVTTI